MPAPVLLSAMLLCVAVTASPAIAVSRSSRSAVGWGNLHIGQFGGAATGVGAATYADGYPSPQNPVPSGDFSGSADCTSVWGSLGFRTTASSVSGLAYVKHVVTTSAVSDDTLTITAPGVTGGGTVRYLIALHGAGTPTTVIRQANASLFIEHDTGFVALASNTAAGALLVSPPEPFTFGSPFRLAITLEGQSLLEQIGTVGSSNAAFRAGVVTMIVTTDGGAPVPNAAVAAASGASYPPASPCPGDVSYDGVVNFSDLSVILGNFGAAAGVGVQPGDANYDGRCDFADLSMVIAQYGTSCL